MLFEVKAVDTDSPAARCGIRKGDRIVSVNGEPLIDYIDYVFFCARENLKIKILRDEKTIALRVRKSGEEDLGLHFTQSLLGGKRVCANKCIFCFVDQLPRGMRKSLYVKDEDWRYSFLMGNYVTLSTLGREDFSRILKRRVSPLYISVHTVDEALRRRMLGNSRARAIRPLLKKLASGRVRFHAQVVVCPGVNDKDKLEETYRFLKRLYPRAMSLAVVPVGLTGFRDGLFEIEPVSQSAAKEVIKTVEKWQEECLNSIKTRFVFASDEFYIKAGADLPEAHAYEAYSQIENGVGLVSKFVSEAESALEKAHGAGNPVSIATGRDMYPFMTALIEKAQRRIAGLDARVYQVENNTFGGGVTVSGLLGGQDFIRVLKGQNLGETLLITADALRDGALFLDGMRIEDLEEALGVPVRAVDCDGYAFIAQLTDTKEE